MPYSIKYSCIWWLAARFQWAVGSSGTNWCYHS